MTALRERIRHAWQGRVSGCQLGKAVELLSMTQGHAGLTDYLSRAGALPLRDYVPLLEGTLVETVGRLSCRGVIQRSEPDDDINYTVLALLLLEEHGLGMRTSDVARAWLNRLPAAATFTAERAAYRTLLNRAHEWFGLGAEPGFDLAECADNDYSDWIGAQIRADLFGWICPGRPRVAAELARQDAALSHRGDGVNGAVFVAALAALVPEAPTLDTAVDAALREIPADSGAAEAVRLARRHAGDPDGGELIRQRFANLSTVHAINNLALVVWALLSHPEDFSAAIGEVVAAGLDTDCNGATVGGLWGLQGRPIPASWVTPWRGRVAVSLAGIGELGLEELVERTCAVAERLSRDR